MKLEDREWLKAWEKKYWTLHKSTSSRNHNYYMDDKKLTKKDRAKLLHLLEEYASELVFEPGGGTFGFGISMGVYELPTYPGTDPIYLLCVTSKQLVPDSIVGNMSEAYKLIEKFTHSEANKSNREASGFKEKLKSMCYYDY